MANQDTCFFVVIGVIGVLVALLIIPFVDRPITSCNIDKPKSQILDWIKELQGYEQDFDNIDKKLFLQDLVCANEYKHTIGQVTYTYDIIQFRLRKILDLKNGFNYDTKLLYDYLALREYHFLNEENSTSFRNKANQLLVGKIRKTSIQLNQEINEFIKTEILEAKSKINAQISSSSNQISNLIKQNVERRLQEILSDDPQFLCVTGQELGELKNLQNQSEKEFYRALNILANLEETLDQLKQLLVKYENRLQGLNTQTVELQNSCRNNTKIADSDLDQILSSFQLLQQNQDQRVKILRNLKFKLFEGLLDRVISEDDQPTLE